MVALGYAHSMEEYAPQEEYSPLPLGEYRVQIVKSELQATKSGNGSMLVIEMDVLDGQFANRKIWDRLNIFNSNAQAQEIARRTFSAICVAAGTGTVSDSEHLHFKPMAIKVGIEADGRDKHLPVEQQRVQNRVKAYLAPKGATAPAPAQPVAQTAQQPAVQSSAARPTTTAAVAPWNRPAA